MSRYRTSGFGIGGGWTPAVKALIFASVIGFVLEALTWIAGGQLLRQTFGLQPASVTGRFFLWQLVTYIFLHGGFFHILFNMFALYMFGSELENLWGTRQFTKFFFISGIGAALTTVLASPGSMVTTIGASGAIYGILLAYGILFPDRIIYLYMIIPIRAKWFVVIIGAITFLSSISATGGGVAHLAHLGGMIFGLAYLKGGGLFSGIRYRYDRWHRARLRRKFEVYYNDRKRDDDPQRWRRWRN